MANIDLEPVRAQAEVLKWANAQRKQIAELEKNARAEVEAFLGIGNIGYLDGQPFVNWSTYKSNSFDQKAFGADHPELLEQYKSVKGKSKFDVL